MNAVDMVIYNYLYKLSSYQISQVPQDNEYSKNITVGGPNLLTTTEKSLGSGMIKLNGGAKFRVYLNNTSNNTAWVYVKIYKDGVKVGEVLKESPPNITTVADVNVTVSAFQNYEVKACVNYSGNDNDVSAESVYIVGAVIDNGDKII